MQSNIVSSDERFPVYPVVQSLLHTETPHHREERASCVSVPPFSSHINTVDMLKVILPVLEEGHKEPDMFNLF